VLSGALAGPENAMARWLVGTSGYVYRDWRRRFYPPGLAARGWLSYYAATFDTVELNSPFYRLPRAATFRAWAAAVPPHFVFAVKASRFLTHVKRLNDPGPPVTLFLRRARGLAGALGPVLIQLPSTFHLRLDRLDGLLRVLARRQNVRWVLEVRHASWLVAEVFDRLARANVALCLHDWKEQPVAGPLTADFVYVRRHGTRRRYGGSYTEAMLQADAGRVQAWTHGGRDVYFYYNNDGRAAAIRNARRLVELLQKGAVRHRAA
jgi:uncharacterized protein YecE (DUF72 family)